MAELRNETVQLLCEKSHAVNQVTFDEDYNVPDAKPDISRMIQNKGEVSMDEVRLSEGRAFIRGNLNMDLLYVGEKDGKVSNLSAKLPFDEILNLDGIANGDKLCLRWEIEDLTVRMIHSRKLNIKAIVTFYGAVDEMTGVSLPVQVDDENISVKKKTVRLMNLVIHKKDTLRVKEEITLAANKPNIAQLLWYTMDVRGLELRPQEGALRARGELAVFVLYEGDDDENPLQWMEYALPFDNEVECSGCMEEFVPNIETSVMFRSMEVKPDSDGEERILTLDVVLELNMKLYREEEHELILDLYTPSRELVLKKQEQTLERLLVRNFARCRISDRISVKETQGKILQLCHSQGKIQVDRSRIVENGVQVDGIVYMKVLYLVENDEMPFYSMEAMLPFTQVVEARGITESCEYFLQTELEQLFTSMADSNEIDVKAAVGINVLVLKREKEALICQIEEKPLDQKKFQEMPGITVYMVRPKDTLWDIAKRFYTTVEDLCEENCIRNEDEIKVGDPLLVVKKMENYELEKTN